MPVRAALAGGHLHRRDKILRLAVERSTSEYDPKRFICATSVSRPKKEITTINSTSVKARVFPSDQTSGHSDERHVDIRQPTESMMKLSFGIGALEVGIVPFAAFLGIGTVAYDHKWLAALRDTVHRSKSLPQPSGGISVVSR